MSNVCGKLVGVIGGGINDVPALATSDVSFAIGTATETCFIFYT